ncbi:ATP-grasp domain-containing protein [Streptomyces sp. NPDC007084]|uniref:ATP-grasp domain-containing protein n=1 Tax=Streptomyces sp. NPDC007084 TaxID=3154313 RepID=UPI003454894E
MPEHVLIVGPGRDFPARLRRARPGTRTTVLCDITYIGRVREPAENVRVICLRRNAPEQEWIDLALAVHARDPFTRVGSFGESDQIPYAAVAQSLGLPGHSPQTVHLAHDKAAMRAWLREKGIDSTASQRVQSLDELRAFTQRHGMPCIVKPVSSAGSAGVGKVSTDGDLEQAFARAGRSEPGQAAAGVLVEEFLDGPQYSVEAFSEYGEHVLVGITAKCSDPDGFVELGHVSPAGLPEEQRRDIGTYVKRILDALGVQNGPTHTEVVLTGAGPRLIETHVRVGGDSIPDLTLDATGVDLDDCTARQALGEQVLPGIRATLAEARPSRPASAIWFASIDTSGTLVSVTGTDTAAAVPGVSKVSVLAQTGSEIGALTDSDARLASARALGDTPEAALAAAREAVSHLEFRLGARPRDSRTI